MIKISYMCMCMCIYVYGERERERERERDMLAGDGLLKVRNEMFYTYYLVIKNK